MIIYVLGRFRVQAGCVTTALTYTQSAPQPLLHMLSERLSSFCACLVRASAAYAHAQQAPQRLLRTLSARLSSFHAHSECDKVFGNFRGLLLRILSMRQSRFIACSGGAAAALAYYQRAPQRLLRMLSLRQSFVTLPIVAESKNLFSKKHSFVNREILFREKSKIGDNKILILVYL